MNAAFKAENFIMLKKVHIRFLQVSKLVHDTVQFRAKALGTPTPNILWQKDDEPIFVTQVSAAFLKIVRKKCAGQKTKTKFVELVKNTEC